MTENLSGMLREAHTLQREQRVAEAIAAYQKLLLLHPDHAVSWFNLGLLLRQIRRPDDALICYKKALELGISNPEDVYLNRGVIYADYLHQDDAAQREYTAALTANPHFISAMLNLANIHEDNGRRAQALELYERALTLDPQCFAALARYANAQPAAESEALVPRLRAAIASDAATDDDRAMLGFALGRSLDAIAAYDEAFTAFGAANESSRAAAGAPRYDPERHTQWVDRLIARGSIAVRASAAAGKPRPIFICGMFRSGSTLIEQLLANHDGVAAGGELDILPAIVSSELQPFPEAMASLTTPALGALARRYIGDIRALHPEAKFVTDKRPDNFLYVGIIKAMFPDAKIVHTTRDALDNCLSLYFLHLDARFTYASDLMNIGHYYREYLRLMAHWKQRFGADIVEVNYDSFVSSPDSVAPALFNSLGLQWNAQFLQQAVHRSVKTASNWQVREPIYAHSSGRSRHYARQLGPLRDYLSAALA